MEVNFFAGARLSKMLVPAMTTSKGGRGGAVVWVSSVQGLFGLPFRSSYAASKFAVQGYAEAMRAELSCEGVRVRITDVQTRLSCIDLFLPVSQRDETSQFMSLLPPPSFGYEGSHRIPWLHPYRTKQICAHWRWVGAWEN